MTNAQIFWASGIAMYCMAIYCWRRAIRTKKDEQDFAKMLKEAVDDLAAKYAENRDKRARINHALVIWHQQHGNEITCHECYAPITARNRQTFFMKVDERGRVLVLCKQHQPQGEAA